MGARVAVLLLAFGTLAVAALAARVVFAGEQGYLGAVLFLNGLPLTLGMAFSFWLLRGTQDRGSQLVALLPTLLPAALSMVWLTRGVLSPAPVAPGIEHVLVPQVALMTSLLSGLAAWPAVRWLGRRRG